MGARRLLPAQGAAADIGFATPEALTGRGLAVPWTLHAISTDDTGWWVVGPLLLLIGVGSGLVAVLAVRAVVASRSAHSRTLVIVDSRVTSAAVGRPGGRVAESAKPAPTRHQRVSGQGRTERKARR